VGLLLQDHREFRRSPSLDPTQAYAPSNPRQPEHPILQLQRTIGNRAVSRLLQPKLQRQNGDQTQRLDLQRATEQGFAPLRTDKTCSDPTTLPISESFQPSATATLYSRPFHAAAGTTINIDLAAELDSAGRLGLGTVGVELYQCCDIRDSKLTDQKIGGIGAPGSPAHTSLSVKLSDQCALPSKSGSDLIYYLRLRIASSSEDVRLSYSVK
jgi:hypothetical protein